MNARRKSSVIVIALLSVVTLASGCRAAPARSPYAPGAKTMQAALRHKGLRATCYGSGSKAECQTSAGTMRYAGRRTWSDGSKSMFMNQSKPHRQWVVSVSQPQRGGGLNITLQDPQGRKTAHWVR